MPKTDYSTLAREVVKAVGGKENIISVTNCMTRLRFVLKDDSVPNADEVKKIKGVKGVMNQGGQYQVIIGTTVNEVVKDVIREAGLSGQNDSSAVASGKKDNLWNRFFKTLSGCIMPMLGPMVAGGIIKGVLTILVTIGVLSSTDGTYVLLYAAADAVMYFMPILVGFTAGKMFGASPYLTAVIGAAFLYPDLLTAAAAEGGMTFLHIPVQSATYSNTFLPVLLAAFLASKLEKAAKKVIPPMLQMMFVPVVVLAIIVPAGWLIIGPLMNGLSSILSTVINGIFGFSPLIGGALIGAFWQMMVVLGLHYAFIPILMNNFFTNGFDPINGVMGITVWALAGIALGYAIKSKDPEKKSMGFGNFASTMCGITEPTIYSIALPNIKLFACAWIGGGLGGAVLGALGAKLYVFAGDGLFRIAGMINPAGLDISFYSFIVCAPAAMIISAVLAYFVTENEENPSAQQVISSDNKKEVKETSPEHADSITICAPVSGTVMERSQIPDATFAEGILGDGAGIDPSDEIITAPFDGTISTITDTRHAIGITSKDGMELLIHVGVDTVKMNGDGFKVFVREGDTVKAGSPLLNFNIEKIRKAGLSPVVAVLVTNSDDYSGLKVQTGECQKMDRIISVAK